MVEFSSFQLVLRDLTLVVGFALSVFLFVSGAYRRFPAFAFYFVLNLAQGLFFLFFYSHYELNSMIAWRVGWASQAIVICARGVAVAELCRLILAQYRGVWALASRILSGSAVLVLLYSLISSKRQWESALPSAERALDLAIAFVIVGILLFARFYEVRLDPTVRTLALGFFLFSAFGVLNDTILERWLNDYSGLWNILNSLAFLASNFLWIWALRKPYRAVAPKDVLLPSGVYQSLAPEINLRLRLLNEQLSRFWHAEAKHS